LKRLLALVAVCCFHIDMMIILSFNCVALTNSSELPKITFESLITQEDYSQHQVTPEKILKAIQSDELVSLLNNINWYIESLETDTCTFTLDNIKYFLHEILFITLYSSFGGPLNDQYVKLFGYVNNRYALIELPDGDTIPPKEPYLFRRKLNGSIDEDGLIGLLKDLHDTTCTYVQDKIQTLNLQNVPCQTYLQNRKP
jgi:hypothetical protein